MTSIRLGQVFEILVPQDDWCPENAGSSDKSSRCRGGVQKIRLDYAERIAAAFAHGAEGAPWVGRHVAEDAGDDMRSKMLGNSLERLGAHEKCAHYRGRGLAHLNPVIDCRELSTRERRKRIVFTLMVNADCLRAELAHCFAKI